MAKMGPSGTIFRHIRRPLAQPMFLQRGEAGHNLRATYQRK